MDAHPAMKEFVLTKVMRSFFSTERGANPELGRWSLTSVQKHTGSSTGLRPKGNASYFLLSTCYERSSSISGWASLRSAPAFRLGSFRIVPAAAFFQRIDWVVLIGRSD